MTLKHLAIGLLATGLAVAAPALAMEGHGEGGWHQDGLSLLHGAKLTDAQKTQVHQIVQTGMSGMQLTGRQMHDLHDQLTQSLLSGATLAQASTILQKEEALRTEMDTQRLALAVKLRDVLTPAQLAAAATQNAKLVSLRDQEHALMHGDE